MRVLLVSHTYVVRPYREKLIALAGQAEVELCLLTPKTWRHPLREIPFIPAPEDDGYGVLASPIHLNGRNGRFMFPWIALFRLLKRLKPQILHLEEEPLSMSALQGIILNRLASRAKVVLFSWENISLRHGPLRRLVEHFVIRHSDYIIAGNAEARRVLLDKGAHPSAIGVLPQIGVTLRTDPGACGPEPIRSFTVGYVGRLVAAKGLLTLLSAFSKLAGASQLLIVGDGTQREKLDKKAEELGISSRMTITGSVPHEKVDAYLGKMDVLVLPSLTTDRWKEQFGHVLIEAMALGIPVVGSDSGAIPEVIGDAGIVVPEGDAVALSVVLGKLGRDPELREALVKAGRTRCLSLYTNDHIAERTDCIYRCLLRTASR